MPQNVEKKFDLTILGSLCEDEIILPNKKIKAPGGAVFYSSFPAKKLGYKVAIITKLPKKNFSVLNKFKKYGIDTFVKPAKKSVIFRNIYLDKDNINKRRQEIIGNPEPFKIKDLPDIETRILHIAPLIKGEVSLKIIKKFWRKVILSLDVQGFAKIKKGKKVIISSWPTKERVLKYITVLKTDDEEIKVLTGKKDIKESAGELVKYGPREIMITSGSGVYICTNKKFFYNKFSPNTIRGRTGRGDTCIATYLVKRLSLSPEKALKYAAEITSKKLEVEGPYK
ncbi:hypothetical protein J7K86_00060 [bacterium]|nr:hypothetical protein [bacterium]